MTTAFIDGSVLTGTGEVLEHATVLVENDKIVKVANGDINIPPGATKIPLEAIESATRIAAKALSLENQIGTIGEGKLADLLVVTGNPLDDIGLLCNQENIHLVMQGGNLVKGSEA